MSAALHSNSRLPHNKESTTSWAVHRGQDFTVKRQRRLGDRRQNKDKLGWYSMPNKQTWKERGKRRCHGRRQQIKRMLSDDQQQRVRLSLKWLIRSAKKKKGEGENTDSKEAEGRKNPTLSNSRDIQPVATVKWQLDATVKFRSSQRFAHLP